MSRRLLPWPGWRGCLEYHIDIAPDVFGLRDTACPRLVPHSPGLPAQQDDQAEYPAHQHVGDLEQNGQPSTTASSLSAIAQVSKPIEYSSDTG